MLLIVGASSEKEDVGWPTIEAAIAEPQCPETVNRDPLAIGTSELAVEVEVITLLPICIDTAITKVAHKQIIAEAAEIRRGEDQPPGRVELTVRSHALEEVAVGIEDINEAVALACDVIVLVGILFGIGDIEVAVQVLDVEGGKSGGDTWVREGPGEAGRLKVLVEHVDGASMEISSVEKVVGANAADGQPFVDRTRG